LTGEGRGEGDSSEIPPAVNFDTFAGYWIVAAINQGGRAFSIEIDKIEDMQYLWEMKSKDFEKLKTLLEPVFRQKGVSRVLLFGSGARDTETRKSDVDLFVVMDTDKRFFDRYDDFDEIYDLLKGRGVDLLIYTESELKNIAHRKFIRNVLAEGKSLYEHWFYIPTRYPNGLPDITPDVAYTDEDAEACIGYAKNVIETVAKIIGWSAYWPVLPDIGTGPFLNVISDLQYFWLTFSIPTCSITERSLFERCFSGII
jgi:predicted nucleotidyltransferase